MSGTICQPSYLAVTTSLSSSFDVVLSPQSKLDPKDRCSLTLCMLVANCNERYAASADLHKFIESTATVRAALWQTSCLLCMLYMPHMSGVRAYATSQKLKSAKEVTDWLGAETTAPTLPLAISAPGLKVANIFSSVSVSSIPNAALGALQWLNLAECNLTKVPEALQQCHNMWFLDLHGNPISELPEFLSPMEMRSLRALNISLTNIRFIPICFAWLTCLVAHGLRYLTADQKVHAQQSGMKLLQYLRTNCGRMQPLRRLTAMFLGPPNVGKTRIMECMMKDAPGVLALSSTLRKHRRRTIFPIVRAHTHLPADGSLPIEILFTDPPGMLRISNEAITVMVLDYIVLKLALTLGGSLMCR